MALKSQLPSIHPSVSGASVCSVQQVCQQRCIGVCFICTSIVISVTLPFAIFHHAIVTELEICCIGALSSSSSSEQFQARQLPPTPHQTAAAASYTHTRQCSRLCPHARTLFLPLIRRAMVRAHACFPALVGDLLRLLKSATSSCMQPIPQVAYRCCSLPPSCSPRSSRILQPRDRRHPLYAKHLQRTNVSHFAKRRHRRHGLGQVGRCTA